MKLRFLNLDLELKISERFLQIENEFLEFGALMLFSGEVEDRYLSTFEVIDSVRYRPIRDHALGLARKMKFESFSGYAVIDLRRDPD